MISVKTSQERAVQAPRGARVLVVDGTSVALISFLQSLRFLIVPLPPGIEDQIENPRMSDPAGNVLCQRILVTNRPVWFRLAAAVHEFSIVDVSGCSEDPAMAGAEVANSCIQLRQRGHVPYIVRLRAGEISLERVE